MIKEEKELPDCVMKSLENDHIKRTGKFYDFIKCQEIYFLMFRYPIVETSLEIKTVKNEFLSLKENAKATSSITNSIRYGSKSMVTGARGRLLQCFPTKSSSDWGKSCWNPRTPGPASVTKQIADKLAKNESRQ